MADWSYGNWKEEITELMLEVDRVWCRDRVRKLCRLETLCRQGSQYLDHGAERFIPDRDELGKLVADAVFLLRKRVNKYRKMDNRLKKVRRKWERSSQHRSVL